MQVVGKHEVEFFFAHAPVRPTSMPQSPAVVSVDANLVAFWWVNTTSNRHDASMEVSVMPENGINIPVLVNSRDIEANTPLLKFKAKANDLQGSYSIG